MAKVTFLQGKARGKVGGIVYRTEAGLGTIASEYNPSPRNPRTLAQTKQRSKMNLGGQISKITPSAAIAGLGVNRRVARSRFMSNLLKATTIVSESSKAQLEWSRLIFSEGVTKNAVATAAYDSAAQALKATVNLDGTEEEILGAIVMMYAAPTNTEPIAAVGKVTGLTGVVDFRMPAPWVFEEENVNLNVYVIPIRNTGEDAVVSYGNLTMQQETLDAPYVRNLVASAAYCASVAALHTQISLS